MAFANVKITLTMGAATGDHWSESVYWGASSVGTLTPRAGAVLIADNLVAKRRACLCSVFTILSIRIAPAYIPPVPANATRASLKYRVLNSGEGTMTQLRDAANTVVVVPIKSTNGHTRNYPLHGYPDAGVVFNAAGVENVVLYNEAKAYFDFLINNNFQLRVEKLAFNAGGLKKVTSIAYVGGVVSFTCPGLAQLNPGDKIIVSSAKGYKVAPFNNPWRVNSHDIVTGVITTSTQRLVDSQFFYVGSSASIRPVNADLVAYENMLSYEASQSQPGSHKVGNPFDGHRGRQSGKR